MDGLDLIWSRPAGLAALALPVLLLLFARLRTRPPQVATGTFSLWRRLSSDRRESSRSHRPRVPLSTWVLALALTLGALALAGPRLEAPAGARIWTVLVDRAPSTGLAWLAQDGFPPSEGPTRLERAADAACDWLGENAAAADLVRWTSPGRQERVTEPTQRPDPAWFQVSAGARRPEVSARDLPGSLLVTDRRPEPEPLVAGWFASGGAAVHGVVAADTEGLWVWDGQGLERVESEDPAGRVVLDESTAALAEPVHAVVTAWAAGRGVAVAQGERSGRLVVRADGAASSLQADVGRDGWWARARYRAGSDPPDAEHDWERWLEGPRGSVLIWHAPGRVHLRLDSLELREGDPAVFALSWARLLDGAMLGHEAVVSLEERSAAGAPSQRVPRAPRAAPAERERLTRLALDAWLAGLAAFLALVALAVER